MRLFLVRHGETVDNVAGRYAGTRNSPLTAHGVLQAKRLAADFAKKKQLGITHLFSSDLKRAVDTALAVFDAQRTVETTGAEGGDAPEAAAEGQNRLNLVQLPGLRERDFRSGEGKKFGFVQIDAETHEEMKVRATKFVEEQLVPLLEQQGDEGEPVVVVVAHGLILGSLWKVLLARFGGAGRRADSPVAWSNTGYLEIVLKCASAYENDSSTAMASGDREAQQLRHEMLVVGVNVLTHLGGLKKTRGGIGSAQFDKRQRTMDSFFGPLSKKARADRE